MGNVQSAGVAVSLLRRSVWLEKETYQSVELSLLESKCHKNVCYRDSLSYKRHMVSKLANGLEMHLRCLGNRKGIKDKTAFQR